ncbi:arylsulfatase [Paraburkholderia sp. UYCP14C]|uniref:arylsulfatase n=1 Tax=Paraburkholderia sp. UYCP14C TaxID=2511130 RepID=UPI0010227195|nr:arylsulfatase [Paraburkholderia sp. UYCP14C]RZF24802.1 arylsulfatase [Paraburkholderia sp. UYCP14C]
MRISFLHTIENNRQVFEHAATEMGLRPDDLRHAVRADLREAVERVGTFDSDTQAQTRGCLLELASNADAVVLTCATLGPIADEIGYGPVPFVRADAALAVTAAEAAQGGGKIAVLCAAEGAIESNRKLFTRYAQERSASVEIIHVPQVWALLRSGEMDACFAAIASATKEAYAAGASVVAFAHPWMAQAADLASKASEGKRPLDSAHAALNAVMQRVN